MVRVLRFSLLTLALASLATAWPLAQGAAGQKPPDPKPAAAAARDAQKPAAPAQELPAEAVAFNEAAGEKNPLKRVEALEKFIADHPKAAPMLLSMARTQINSSVLAAFKDSRAKFLAQTEKDIADAAKRADAMPVYSTYNRLASSLLNAGIYSEEAEDFARKGLAGMDERAYMDMRKAQYERSLASYEKMTAAASGAKPAEAGAAAAATPSAAATPAAPAPAGGAADAPPAPNYRIAMKDGVMQASLAPPAPPRPATPPRPPVRPTMPTEDEMRASLKSERASALATLGQILMKRGKAEEGEKALAEAYAAKPAASTMAAIARTLAESAKKAGNDALQLEYLTVLALSGRITADETKDFEAAYRKTHGDSLDGLEAMLDERYRRDHVRFAVTPFVRKPPAKATGKTVLAEIFPGAG
jgi:tetratricopeptide (TPR) repeat protein